MPNYDSDEYADSPLFKVRKEIEELSEKKILVKQAETLGEQFNYDDSRSSDELFSRNTGSCT